MSSVLFDVPGPRARRRHLVYSGLTVLALAGVFFVVGKRLYDEEALTPELLNQTFQNRYVEFLLEGMLQTLKAAVLGISCALVFGVVLAVGRISIHRILRWPTVAVIEFFRAVPLVMLIIFIFYGIRNDELFAVVAGLTLYNGAVLAEVFRAGVNAVPKGQSEAAYAIGMRKTQVTSIVLLPQAVKFMLPAIVSQCVIVLKDTALGYVIVYAELVRYARQLAGSVDNSTILVYSTVALMFIVINYGLSKLAEYLQRRMSRSRPDVDDGAAQVSRVKAGEMGGGGPGG